MAGRQTPSFTFAAPSNGVVVTGVSFTDEFSGTSGGGVGFLNGTILSKMVVTINFYTLLQFVGQMQFINASKSIVNVDAYDSRSFITMGFLPGMTIAITGTVSNNATYTIASVQAQTIVLTTAPTNEICSTTTFADTTTITAIDFLYNLIPNNAAVNFNSLTDANVRQRYTASGLSASDTSTVHKFLLGTSSRAWSTNNIDNIATGECSDTTIVGAGVIGGKQAFTITHTLRIVPTWLREYLTNYQNGTFPPTFLNNCLQYILGINAKFSAASGVIPYGGIYINNDGLTAWYNQNNIGTSPEYYVQSIKYTDAGGNTIVPTINQTTYFTIILKSKSGLFDWTGTPATSTHLAIDFLYCDQKPSDYQNTPTTLRQNLYNDRVFEHVQLLTNSEFNGTNYQTLGGIFANVFDANTLQISGSLTFSAQFINLIKNATATNRYYALFITTQDITITNTDQTERVCCLADFNQFAYDTDDATLLQPVDTFRFLPFPELVNYKTAVNDWEGSPYIVQFPFQVLNTEVNGVAPKLLNAAMAIVAVKDGQPDFVLESQTFDTSQNGVACATPTQLIQARPFPGPASNPFNTSSLFTNSNFDIPNYTGMLLTYAFALRYEYWIPALQQAIKQISQITCDLPGISAEWDSMQGEGWSLAARFTGNVHGYDGNTTEFLGYAPIIIKASGDPPDIGPVFTQTINYYDTDNNPVNSLIIGQKTLVLVTFTGDFTTMPAGYNGFFAYIFADYQGSQGINTRRFASTQFDSEADSPWSAAPADMGASYSMSTVNLTMNVFNYSKVTVAAYYDDAVQNWGLQQNNALIYPKLGFLTPSSSS